MSEREPFSGGIALAAPRLLPVRRDHGCFGCGDANPNGLRLAFVQIAEDAVAADFLPGRVHEGFAGIVHGGLVTTLLDEAMAWSTFVAGAWAVTAQMEVRFRLPVLVGEPVRAIGRCTPSRGRLIRATGEVRRGSDDELLASATGAFVRVPDERAEAWRTQYLVDRGDDSAT